MKKLIRLIPLLAVVGLLLFWPSHGWTKVAAYSRGNLNVSVYAMQVGGTISHKVVLTWNAGTPDATHVAATGFNVKRGATAGSEATIGTTVAPTTTYTDTNVSGGDKWFYVVTGTGNNLPESAPSNEVSVQVPLDQVAAPTGLAGASQ